MNTSIRFAAAALATLVVAGDAARAEEKGLPNFDAAVREQAPKVLAALKAKGYKSIGVLKFLARAEGGAWRDNLGPVNRTLADRLEIALLVSLKPQDGMGIIFRASDAVAASGNARATHRNEDGRAEFFGYDPSPFYFPWNMKARIQPDAFLTGEATLSGDLRRMTVKLQVFGNSGSNKLKLEDVCEFVAAVDPRTLTEAGVSFVGARGPFDKPIDAGQFTAQVVKDAPRPDDTAEQWQKRADALLADMKALPIRVEILYSDEPVTVEANPFRPPAERDNVLLRVREPLSREKVSFRLTNQGTDTFGVVFKVNGQNSIFREEKAALDCYKWILEPGKSVRIAGFQLDNMAKLDFDVKSEAESRKEEMKYGDNAGTFTVTVFRAAKTEAEKKMVKNDDQATDLTAAMIGRGTQQLAQRISASDLASFQGELRRLTEKAQDEKGSRGVIGAGKVGVNPVMDVKFTPVPRPAFSATIRYYDPKGK
jgi:hypothetical protein